MQLPTELDGAFMLWDTRKKPTINIDIQMLHRSRIMLSNQKLQYTEVFGRHLLCSTRMHLFNTKCSKIVNYNYNLNIF